MDELDEVIRTLRDDAPDEDARHAARNALRAQMRVAQKTSLRRRPVRRIASAAGLAAAAVLAIALWPVGGSDEGVGLAPASAEAALERAARAAQSGAERALSPGEYFYVRERSAYLTTNAGEGAGWSALVPSERETWTRRDGSGRFVARDSGPPTFPGPRDRANWKAQGSPSLDRSVGPAAGMRFPPSPITAGGSSLQSSIASASVVRGTCERDVRRSPRGNGEPLQAARASRLGSRSLHRRRAADRRMEDPRALSNPGRAPRPCQRSVQRECA